MVTVGATQRPLSHPQKLPLRIVVGGPNIWGVGRLRRFDCALVPALRRVDGVRLIVGEGPLRAEVYGIGHRFPTKMRVTVKLAAQLVQAGAPLTVLTRPASPTVVEVS